MIHACVLSLVIGYGFVYVSRRFTPHADVTHRVNTCLLWVAMWKGIAFTITVAMLAYARDC